MTLQISEKRRGRLGPGDPGAGAGGGAGVAALALAATPRCAT